MKKTKWNKIKLNNILFDILINNKDRYNDLFKHEFIENIIGKTAYDFNNNTGVEYDDTENMCREIIFNLLEDEFKVDDNIYIARDFLSLLKCILYKRLFNYKNKIDFREYNKETLVINLSGLNINIESLNDKFIEKDFSDEVNSKLYLKEFRKVLSKREKEVFNYIFIKDYTQQKIADKLNVSQQAINIYKNRILKKIKKYVCNK
jgi:RNA polymerase sigma factor (sigma-70 family)